MGVRGLVPSETPFSPKIGYLPNPQTTFFTLHSFLVFSLFKTVSFWGTSCEQSRGAAWPGSGHMAVRAAQSPVAQAAPGAPSRALWGATLQSSLPRFTTRFYGTVVFSSSVRTEIALSWTRGAPPGVRPRPAGLRVLRGQHVEPPCPAHTRLLAGHKSTQGAGTRSSQGAGPSENRAFLSRNSTLQGTANVTVTVFVLIYVGGGRGARRGAPACRFGSTPSREWGMAGRQAAPCPVWSVLPRDVIETWSGRNSQRPPRPVERRA